MVNVDQVEVIPRHRWSATDSRRKREFNAVNLLVAILALAGITVFTYPLGAKWVSQYNQSNVIYDQAKVDAESGKDFAEAKIKEAQEYNQLLKTHAVLASGSNLAEGLGDNVASYNYTELLSQDPTGIMARLRMRSIDLDLPVYHGTSDEVLLKGVGHLKGTSLPVGGEGTRAVLTGHRGLAESTIFTNLDKVKEGDTFSVEALGEVFAYRVFDIRVINPEDTEEIRAVPGRDLATLITCTPLGINTHRILITGERIFPTPQEDLDDAGSKPTVPHFPWWLILYLLSVTVICLWYWHSYRPTKKRNNSQATQDNAENEKNKPHPSEPTPEPPQSTNQPGATKGPFKTDRGLRKQLRNISRAAASHQSNKKGALPPSLGDSELIALPKEEENLEISRKNYRDKIQQQSADLHETTVKTPFEELTDDWKTSPDSIFEQIEQHNSLAAQHIRQSSAVAVEPAESQTAMIMRLEAELTAAQVETRRLLEERDLLRQAAKYFAAETNW